LLPGRALACARWRPETRFSMVPLGILELLVDTGCGDVDVGGIGKRDANVGGGVRDRWQGASVRGIAGQERSTGGPVTPHSPLPRARSIGVSPE